MQGPPCGSTECSSSIVVAAFLRSPAQLSAWEGELGRDIVLADSSLRAEVPHTRVVQRGGGGGKNSMVGLSPQPVGWWYDETLRQTTIVGELTHIQLIIWHANKQVSPWLQPYPPWDPPQKAPK